MLSAMLSPLGDVGKGRVHKLAPLQRRDLKHAEEMQFGWEFRPLSPGPVLSRGWDESDSSPGKQKEAYLYRPDSAVSPLKVKLARYRNYNDSDMLAGNSASGSQRS